MWPAEPAPSAIGSWRRNGFPSALLRNTRRIFSNESVTEEVKTEEESEAVEEVSLETIEDFIWNESRDFIFYDTFTDLLPGVVTIDKLDDYPAVRDFEKVFSVNFSEVAKLEERAITREEMRLNKEASDDLDKYWKQRLEEGGEYNFNVKIVPQTEEAKSKIEFKIDRKMAILFLSNKKVKAFVGSVLLICVCELWRLNKLK